MDDTPNSLEPAAMVQSLKLARANPETIGQELAQFVRRMMRAAINGDPYSVNQATESFLSAAELLAALEDPKFFHTCFEQAVTDLRVETHHSNPESKWVDVASAGATYYLEMSAPDGYARARASQRKDDIQSALSAHAEYFMAMIQRKR